MSFNASICAPKILTHEDLQEIVKMVDQSKKADVKNTVEDAMQNESGSLITQPARLRANAKSLIHQAADSLDASDAMQLVARRLLREASDLLDSADVKELEKGPIQPPYNPIVPPYNPYEPYGPVIYRTYTTDHT